MSCVRSDNDDAEMRVAQFGYGRAKSPQPGLTKIDERQLNAVLHNHRPSRAGRLRNEPPVGQLAATGHATKTKSTTSSNAITIAA